MKMVWCITVIWCGVGFHSAWAQMEATGPVEMQTVFSGEHRVLSVQLSNKGDHMVEHALSTRLWQASSATLMPVGERVPWKTMQILPGQTVLEKLDQSFPDIQTVTLFELAILDSNTNELGRLRVRVCPRDILSQVARLSGGKPPGVLDPENTVKPTLMQQRVLFQDLDDNAGFDNFSGALAIIGPVTRDRRESEAQSQRVTKALSKRPLSLVWILPPQIDGDALPGMWMIRYETQAVVMVQSSEIANLATSPTSQIHLLQAVSLARKPELLQLPKPEL